MLQILFSLMNVKYIFYCFIEVLDLKRILHVNTLKNLLCQPWNSLTLQLSLWLCDEYNFCLLCTFILPEATIINLFAILRVFLVGLGKVNSLAVSSKRGKRFEGKRNL